MVTEAIARRPEHSVGTPTHAETVQHKHTEVGIIPEDWDVFPIRRVCKLINGRGFKPYEWRSAGLPIIRIQNLNGSDEFNYYDGTYDKKLEIHNGQLLFAWSGSRGTSFGPHIWNGPLGLLNYHTWKVDIDTDQIDPAFFFHALKQLTKFIEDNAHGASALVHTQKWEMEGFLFPAPSKRSEQLAIAEALADADKLIEGLESLVIKKRQIKQGAMQELLNPEPGWTESNLGELCCFENGDRGVNYPSKFDLVSFGHPFVNAGHLRDGKIDQNDLDYITTDKLCQLGGGKFRSDDILFSLRGTLGKYALVDESVPTGAIASSLIIIRPVPNKLNVRFLYYYLQSHHCARMIDLWAGGAAQPNLGGQDLARFSVFLPASIDNQIEISATLSALDDEIEMLEAKLAKVRQIKQGMMQELLTGRVGLV